MGLIQNIFTRLAGNTAKGINANMDAKFYLSKTQFEDYTTLQQNTLEQFEHWTYKAIDLKGKAMSSITLRHVNNGQNKPESKVLKDLFYFNAVIGWEQAVYLAIAHLSLAGAAYWYIMPSTVKGYKYNFIPLTPTNMKIIPDRITGLPIAYSYSDLTGTQTRLELNEVVAMYTPDPRNWLKAYSPLQASRYAHNITEFSLKYNQNVFGNMGSLQGFMVFEGMSAEDRAVAEQIMREKYTGTQNAGKVGILNRMFHWLELGKTPKDLDFQNSYEAMRDTILSIQGVPKDLVVGGSTFENMKEAQRVFQLYTLKPLVDLIQSAINRQLMSRYSETGVIEFENPVQADKKVVSETAMQQYNGGVITLNEARALIGFEEIQEGNQLKNEGKLQQVKLPEETQKQLDDILAEAKTFKQKALTIEAIHLAEKLKDDLYQKSIETEDTIKPILKRFFEAQKERILNPKTRTKSLTVNSLPIDWENENEFMAEILDEISELVQEEYTKQAGGFLGLAVSVSAASLLELREANRVIAQEINETTRKDIRKLLSQAILQKDSYETLETRIKELFADYEGERLDFIALQEVNRIKNGTLHDIYTGSGIWTEYVIGLQWVALHDGKTRKSHREADGQTVEKDELFIVGGVKMRYPGDPRAPMREKARCRCYLLPITK